jgi:L-fuculose-phosphate aldolase
MSKVITAREADEMVRRGEKPPAGAVLTPSARDVFGGLLKPAFKTGIASAEKTSAAPSVPDFEFKWPAGSDPKTPAEIEKFFNSPAIQVLKERICDMGRRLWQREYTDGNGGNITIRVGDNSRSARPRSSARVS